jgi:hypothetical protein
MKCGDLSKSSVPCLGIYDMDDLLPRWGEGSEPKRFLLYTYSWIICKCPYCVY